MYCTQNQTMYVMYNLQKPPQKKETIPLSYAKTTIYLLIAPYILEWKLIILYPSAWTESVTKKQSDENVPAGRGKQKILENLQKLSHTPTYLKDNYDSSSLL